METQSQETRPAPDWHSLSTQEVMTLLRTDEDGLTEDRVSEVRAQVGLNVLKQERTRGPLARFLAQFSNLLIYVLLAAALLAALLQHWIDAVVIFLVVLVNAIIGFVQEGRAEKALEAIRNMLSPHAVVIRKGVRQTIPAEELVPGDCVLLESGDKIPADLRLIHVKGLQIQEAILTGESLPVTKQPEPVQIGATLGDRFSMAYSGTLVTSGRGMGLVIATGMSTEIGRISSLLAEVQTLETPLIKAMHIFAKWLTYAIVGLAGLVFAFAFFLRDYSLVESFMASVALAVAAIPEGLPAILTVTLAMGVQRMAGRNAIIRRLPAVETLGSVSIICSDKTGTLTRNEMMVRTVVVADGNYTLTGMGYDPHGQILQRDAEVEIETRASLREAFLAMTLCNDARLRREGEDWRVEGDPMEGALLTAGRKAGLDSTIESQHLPRTDVIPFESEHQFMASLHHDHEGNGWIFVKGAPERVLEMCSSVRADDGGERELDRETWLQGVDAMADNGERVLAVAMRKVGEAQSVLHFTDVESGLVLLGLFGLIDPPRDEAIAAVAECQHAGIGVKMITGDHAGTARAISRQLGLARPDGVLTGREIDRLDDAQLTERIAEVDVFARTSPEHKLRLVQRLQARGYVVAMTGDGVNDAPALKQADVGVAMGRNGTETAKEAAEMVLADDNFASIVNAVREGRTVYDNLKKAITFLLPINGGESGSIILAIALGHALPITPLQVLWVNMVSSVGLAMALAFEPAERDIMRRPPRRPGEPILSGFVLWRILLVSVLFLIGIFGIFRWSLAQGFSVELARTHAVNTLVVMEVFYLLSVRSLRTRTLSLTGLLGTRAVLIAVTLVLLLQMMFTYAPFMQFFFATQAMAPREAALIVLIGFVLFLILEFERWVRVRWLQVKV
jgi:magnesium-transporting ATPase (P-type)